MSSYFDAAARKLQGLATVEERQEFAQKVVERVRGYLEYISNHSPATHQRFVHYLEQKFERVSQRKEWDTDGAILIEDLHSLAHDIGNARIPVKFHPKQRFLDNPCYEGHTDYKDVET